jgi:cell division septation protein DedD
MPSIVTEAVAPSSAAPQEEAPAPLATQVAAAPPEAPAQAPAAAAETAPALYRLLVASVRSRSEAYALAVRLVSQHASALEGRKPEVQEAVIGSMGTFYRVRLGPYASSEESQQICGSLRATGFDCLVVTQ